MTDQLRLFAIVIALTIASGIGDSQGFLHAARVWRDGALMWDQLLKSALGFTFGIVMYWIAIRFFVESGVTIAETQTLVWFAVTIIGVAALSGQFLHWHLIDQLVAVGALSGIGWLMFRTAV
jgi:hypothetical protein